MTSTKNKDKDKQTIYTVEYNMTVDNDEHEHKTEVYSSQELARQAMKIMILEAKRDCDWWDSENNELNYDEYEVVESQDNFTVYYDGFYGRSHEEWSIKECILDKDIENFDNRLAELEYELDDDSEAKSKQCYDIYLKNFNDCHQATDSPVCYEEFYNNEWQDSECRDYYIMQIREARNDEGEM